MKIKYLSKKMIFLFLILNLLFFGSLFYFFDFIKFNNENEQQSISEKVISDDQAFVFEIKDYKLKNGEILFEFLLNSTSAGPDLNDSDSSTNFEDYFWDVSLNFYDPDSNLIKSETLNFWEWTYNPTNYYSTNFIDLSDDLIDDSGYSAEFIWKERYESSSEEIRHSNIFYFDYYNFILPDEKSKLTINEEYIGVHQILLDIKFEFENGFFDKFEISEEHDMFQEFKIKYDFTEINLLNNFENIDKNFSLNSTDGSDDFIEYRIWINGLEENTKYDYSIIFQWNEDVLYNNSKTEINKISTTKNKFSAPQISYRTETPSNGDFSDWSSQNIYFTVKNSELYLNSELSEIINDPRSELNYNNLVPKIKITNIKSEDGTLVNSSLDNIDILDWNNMLINPDPINLTDPLILDNLDSETNYTFDASIIYENDEPPFNESYKMGNFTTKNRLNTPIFSFEGIDYVESESNPDLKWDLNLNFSIKTDGSWNFDESGILTYSNLFEKLIITGDIEVEINDISEGNIVVFIQNIEPNETYNFDAELFFTKNAKLVFGLDSILIKESFTTKKIEISPINDLFDWNWINIESNATVESENIFNDVKLSVSFKTGKENYYKAIDSVSLYYKDELKDTHVLDNSNSFELSVNESLIPGRIYNFKLFFKFKNGYSYNGLENVSKDIFLNLDKLNSPSAEISVDNITYESFDFNVKYHYPNNIASSKISIFDERKILYEFNLDAETYFDNEAEEYFEYSQSISSLKANSNYYISVEIFGKEIADDPILTQNLVVTTNPPEKLFDDNFDDNLEMEISTDNISFNYEYNSNIDNSIKVNEIIFEINLVDSKEEFLNRKAKYSLTNLEESGNEKITFTDLPYNRKFILERTLVYSDGSEKVDNLNFETNDKENIFESDFKAYANSNNSIELIYEWSNLFNLDPSFSEIYKEVLEIRFSLFTYNDSFDKEIKEELIIYSSDSDDNLLSKNNGQLNESWNLTLPMDLVHNTYYIEEKITYDNQLSESNLIDVNVDSNFSISHSIDNGKFTLKIEFPNIPKLDSYLSEKNLEDMELKVKFYDSKNDRLLNFIYFDKTESEYVNSSEFVKILNTYETQTFDFFGLPIDGSNIDCYVSVGNEVKIFNFSFNQNLNFSMDSNSFKVLNREKQNNFYYYELKFNFKNKGDLNFQNFKFSKLINNSNSLELADENEISTMEIDDVKEIFKSYDSNRLYIKVNQSIVNSKRKGDLSFLKNRYIWMNESDLSTKIIDENTLIFYIYDFNKPFPFGALGLFLIFFVLLITFLSFYLSWYFDKNRRYEYTKKQAINSFNELKMQYKNFSWNPKYENYVRISQMNDSELNEHVKALGFEVSENMDRSNKIKLASLLSDSELKRVKHFSEHNLIIDFNESKKEFLKDKSKKDWVKKLLKNEKKNEYKKEINNQIKELKKQKGDVDGN